MRAAAFLTIAATFFSTANAIQSVSRSGRYLYTGDGNRFYIKGVAYQGQGTVISSPDNPNGTPSTFTDPLVNGTDCKRDLPYLQKLGVNTIRTYSVDNTQNHDDCMSLFSNAGIYTIIDLSLPVNGSIDSSEPYWSTNLLDLYIQTIEVFSKYDNLLAVNVGNEVVTQTTTGSAAFVKAAARDIKAYLNSKNLSTLVGYADIDGDQNWRGPLADYLSCDPSSSNSGATAIDLFGLNNYEWCGNSSFEQSYAGLEADFANYNVPAYFSEFGCITAGTPRPWTEVASLYSSQMSDVWSGGVAFSYFPATSPQGQFGMVNVSSDGSITTGQDFANLASQLSAVSPPNTPSQSNAGSTSYPSCPSSNSTFAASTTLPPTPNDAACSCLENSLPCTFKNQYNYTDTVGTLTGSACSLLAQKGGNCNDIASNGTTGTYGIVAMCDPRIKLGYAMSEWYLANGNQASACSFSDNGVVNASAPSSTSAASSAASSCISSPSATFVPSSVAVTTAASATGSSGSSSGGGSSSSGSSGSSSSAVSLLDSHNVVSIVFASAFALFGGLYTLV